MSVAPTPTPLTFSIGGVELSSFEIPEQFDFGHEMLQATHKYMAPDGTPIIQVQNMGAYPLPTEWEGILYYSTALTRAQQLDQIAATQTPNSPINWIYGSLEFTVFINSFRFTVKNSNEIHYKISLTVLSENFQSSPNFQEGVNPQTPQSLDSSIQADWVLGQQGLASLESYDPKVPAKITQAAANVDALMTLYGVISTQPADNILQLSQTIDPLLAALTAYIKPLKNTATSALDVEKLNAALTCYNGYYLLQQAVNALIALIGSYIGVALSYTGNLYALAAKVYPLLDIPTMAIAIAAANGLSDFWIYTPTDINLPPAYTATSF